MVKATKAQRHKLLVQRVDLAHRWNVDQLATKQNDVALKRTLSRNQVNDEGGNSLVTGIKSIEPMLQGI
jgi:hypothetical protein